MMSEVVSNAKGFPTIFTNMTLNSSSGMGELVEIHLTAKSKPFSTLGASEGEEIPVF